MIRWTGILSAAASALLVVFLLTNTRSGILSGTVAPFPAHVLGKKTSQALPGHTEPVWVATTEDLPPEAFDRFLEAGLELTGHAGSDKDDPMQYWELVMPPEPTERARPGDRLVASARMLLLPGSEGLSHVRYFIGAGAEQRSYDGRGNRLFLLAWGGIAGGPILLWGIAALIAALCGKSRRPIRE